MSYTVNLVEWESRFYGFPIGGVELPSNFSQGKLDETLRAAKERFRLITITIQNDEIKELSTPDAPSVCYDRRLIMKKVVPKNVPSLDPHVKAYTSAFCSKWLERLAVQGGTLSRFKKDPELSMQYERLFLTWINYSVSGELADSIWTWQEEKKHAGLVTIRCAKRINPETQKPEQEGRIGILAVDSEYRRRGIGRQLFEACDFWCSSLEIPTVALFVEIESEETIKLCEKIGYQAVAEESIYHYWAPGWVYDARCGWTRLASVKKA